VESGERSIDAAKRELEEETGLVVLLPSSKLEDGGSSSSSGGWDMIWSEDGPISITDSITVVDQEGEGEGGGESYVKYHYVISQWFVRLSSSAAAASSSSSSSTTVSNPPLPPTLTAGDDAADVKWWDLDEIQKGVERGEVTRGVVRVINRAEMLYDKGIL